MPGERDGRSFRGGLARVAGRSGRPYRGVSLFNCRGKNHVHTRGNQQVISAFLRFHRREQFSKLSAVLLLVTECVIFVMTW